MIIQLYSLRLLFLNLLIFFPLFSYAENFMMVMGGAGDPPGSSTIFDPDVKAMGSMINGSGWNVAVSFDGGHSDTQALVKSSFPNAVSTSDFSNVNFHKMIAQYEADINSGKIKSNDQLMVVIDTHGGENTTPDETNRTHTIATGGVVKDINTLSGTMNNSMDNLQPLIDAATKKGVKLAIMDLSCHSGHTLKLSTPNTCIITGTGTDHPAYPRFSQNLFNNLKKGVSLEDAFLTARMNESLPDYPMINTNAGNRVSSLEYKNISPFFDYVDAKKDGSYIGGNSLIRYIQSNSTPKLICERDEQFKSLNSLISNLERIPGLMPYDPTTLLKLLDDYKKDQDIVINFYKNAGLGNLTNQEKFSSVVLDKDGKNLSQLDLSFSWSELLATNPEHTLEGIRDRTKVFEENLVASKNRHLSEIEKIEIEKDRADLKTTLDVWNQVKVKYDEILTKNPDLKNYQDNMKNMLLKVNANINRTEDIAFYERYFYDAAYRREQLKNPQPSNPCKDFIF